MANTSIYGSKNGTSQVASASVSDASPAAAR